MKAILRKIFSSNIVLYYVWYLLIRKQKGLDPVFFHRNVDVYIDGYPRSGNTFLIHLVKQLIPQLNLVHHLHTIAPIKIAFLLNLPVFILIRNPMDCISSKYLKHFAMREMEVETQIDDQLLDQFIFDYLIYYQFVKEKQDKLIILNFDELIEFPGKAIAKIQDRFNIKKPVVEQEVAQAINSYRGARDTFGSSRPNKEKEKYKALVKQSILQSDKHSEISKLYDSIINHS